VPSLISGKFLEAIKLVGDVAREALRTVVPGKVTSKRRESSRERDVEFAPGPGHRVGGEQVGDGPVDNAPVLYPGGGGFALLWPLDVGDEVLGLCADRGAQAWRANRDPGQSFIFDQRHHNLSDAMLLPVSITAPETAPEDWGDDFYLVGPAGHAIKVAGVDGEITITTANATLTLTQAGDITATTAGTITLDGSTVNAGSPGALALAKADALTSAVDALLAAGVAAGVAVPPAGDSGTVAFTAAQSAWAPLKAAIATTKAKGV
jgi:hypothetical protein